VLNISERLLMDASEFLNVVYDDMSQINELLTLKDQTLIIEGAALFYKGFMIVNSLELLYLQPLMRIANLYDMFERSQSSEEEAIIEWFYLRTKRSKRNEESDDDDQIAEDISIDPSLEGDDDFV